MIDESAPETLEGSFSHSLGLSKLWLCRELKRAMHGESIPRFRQVYCLGSWYGNMALFMLLTHVPFETMIDVDVDPEPLRVSQTALSRLAPDRRIVSICDDANRLRYFLRQPSLVINTSTNNMRNEGWFGNIPRGTMVALQGRSGEPGNDLNTCPTLEEFDAQFPMGSTMFLGSIGLEDDGDRYRRWMKIGVA